MYPVQCGAQGGDGRLVGEGPLKDRRAQASEICLQVRGVLDGGALAHGDQHAVCGAGQEEKGRPVEEEARQPHHHRDRGRARR